MTALDNCDEGDKGMDLYTRFFIRTPDSAALQQIELLLHQRRFASAALLARLETTPQSVWLTGGSPQDVAKLVRKTLGEAEFQRRLPVFVPYNIPGRDCGGYSAGGAQTTPDYEAWIDAIAGAIRSRDAYVIKAPLSRRESQSGNAVYTHQAMLVYAWTVLRGRPPSLPFERAAACLADELERPPARPIAWAIQRRLPNTPSSRAGK